MKIPEYGACPTSNLHPLQIKLGILDEDDEVEETFTFKYHDAPNIPDFMVLKQHFEDSISQRWTKGDKFRSLIDDQWWQGAVNVFLTRFFPTSVPKFKLGISNNV